MINAMPGRRGPGHQRKALEAGGLSSTRGRGGGAPIINERLGGGRPIINARLGIGGSIALLGVGPRILWVYSIQGKGEELRIPESPTIYIYIYIYVYI